MEFKDQAECQRIAEDNWHRVPDDVKAMTKEQMALLISGISAKIQLIEMEWGDREKYAANGGDIEGSECKTAARIFAALDDYKFLGLIDQAQKALGSVSNPEGRGGFVYVAEFADGHVKIGRSSSPQRRLKDIAGANQSKMVRSWISPGTDQPNKVESGAHRNFAAFRAGGEYFRVKFEDAVEWIKSAFFASGKEAA